MPILRDVAESLVRADGPDLTSRALAILLVVRTMPGPHTVRGIAAHLAINKPAVTRNVDRLVERGLMKRAPDPTDRRSVLMTPTTEGNAYVAEFQRAAKQAIARR